jgi:hypothetical protein
MKDYQSVFVNYPDAEQIYVVNGMPFLRRTHADSHARKTGKPVEVIARSIKAEGKGKKAADQADPTEPVTNTDQEDATAETETTDEGSDDAAADESEDAAATASTGGGAEDVIMQAEKGGKKGGKK